MKRVPNKTMPRNTIRQRLAIYNRVLRYLEFKNNQNPSYERYCNDFICTIIRLHIDENVCDRELFPEFFKCRQGNSRPWERWWRGENTSGEWYAPRIRHMKKVIAYTENLIKEES